MVGLGRFELPTSRLSGVRSSQLSYRPPSHWMALRTPDGARRSAYGYWSGGSRTQRHSPGCSLKTK